LSGSLSLGFGEAPGRHDVREKIGETHCDRDQLNDGRRMRCCGELKGVELKEVVGFPRAASFGLFRTAGR
jgi:hypothetical protein